MPIIKYNAQSTIAFDVTVPRNVDTKLTIFSFNRYLPIGSK